MYFFSPLRVGDAENEHVLGEPALVARHHRSDAQREALLAEQRVAAVARAERHDLARLGKVHDLLLVVARPGHVGTPRLSGAPTECSAGTKKPSLPIASSGICRCAS
jgi:hypothetical protein